MFEKKTCERCGAKYRQQTTSESKGRHFCKHCVTHCSVCGEKLPFSNFYGQISSATQAFFGNVFTQSKEREEKKWIGSGMCMRCYRAKEDKEREEQKLIKEAQLAQAKETLETPTVWVCGYCKAVNRGRFCSNCGSARKKEANQNIM